MSIEKVSHVVGCWGACENTVFIRVISRIFLY